LAQDNSTSHEGFATPIIESQVPYKLDWPSRSPDLNPIENLWRILKNKIRKRQPQDLEQLERITLEEWYNIANHVIEHLCESFSNRIQKMMEAKGNKINY